MAEKIKKTFLKSGKFWLIVSLAYLFAVLLYIGKDYFPNMSSVVENPFVKSEKIEPKFPPLDQVDYDKRIFSLANMFEYIKPVSTSSKLASSTKIISSSTASIASSTASTTKYYVTSWGKMRMKLPLWPRETIYPKDGAILPFKRIVAYYGNFYSKNMGILGQYPEAEVLSRLQNEVDKWNLVASDTPALPAIHYIAVTAQGSKGFDGKYRARMPFDQIDRAVEMAKKIHGIVILDIQVGLSDLQSEIPLLEKYLKMPDVHLAIDPEFSMKFGNRPGTVIGTMDAKDINYAIDYLTKLVDEYDLPPKVLIVHRFTEDMVTNYKDIKTVPEVQIVMNMDGWGTPTKKLGTYQYVIYEEPVQFTGFKLFYNNDTKTGTPLMTPEEVLNTTPRPIYIQYQ